jgi:hypothetical protein
MMRKILSSMSYGNLKKFKSITIKKVRKTNRATLRAHIVKDHHKTEKVAEQVVESDHGFLREDDEV